MSDGTMIMREATDGFVVPAGGTFVLEPGANHVMLLGLVGPVRAGSDVEVVLTAEDGTESPSWSPLGPSPAARRRMRPARRLTPR